MKSVLGLLVACVTMVSLQARADLFDAPESIQTSIPGAVITEAGDEIILTIDGNDVQSLQQLHQIFAKALKLPATYGKNFDALYDVLTDETLVSKRLDIGVIGGEALKQNIGAKNVQKLIDVLNDAYEADPMHLSSIYWQ